MKKLFIVALLVLTLFSVVAPPAAFADSGYWCDENGCICYEYGWTFDPWCLCWMPYYYQWPC